MPPKKAIAESSVSHFTVQLNQLLPSDGVRGKICDFIDVDPLLHFLCCEMSSLIGCNVVWDVLLADKPFCEFTDSGAGRNIIRRKG